MRKNVSRGLEDNPGKRSIDSDQPAHHKDGTEDAAQHRDSGRTSSKTITEYRFSKQGTTGKYSPISAVDVDDVFIALVTLADGSETYVDWTDVAQLEGDPAVDLCGPSISRAIGLLAQDEGCPLMLQRWSGPSTTPTTWRAAPSDDNPSAPTNGPVSDGGEKHGESDG